jgi:hypothetical protein
MTKTGGGEDDVPDLCLLYSGMQWKQGGGRQGLRATPHHGTPGLLAAFLLTITDRSIESVARWCHITGLNNAPPSTCSARTHVIYSVNTRSNTFIPPN